MNREEAAKYLKAVLDGAKSYKAGYGDANMILMVTNKTFEALQMAAEMFETVRVIEVNSEGIVKRNEEEIEISGTDWGVNGLMMECPDCHGMVAWASPFCPLCGKSRKKVKE